MSVSLTGSDIIQIGSTGGSLRTLADLADGDTGVLDFGNNLVEGKVGKNGNTIYSFNSTGKQATLTLRVVRGSADDKYFNAEMNLYLRDRAAYPLLTGEFVKRAGDGLGNVTADVYAMNGGIIQKMPNVKENVEGDTEASITEWVIFFANVDRSLT